MQLPEEALANILKRLTPRTLLRYKFVCKSWRSLINDAWFTNQRRQYARQHQNYVDNILIQSVAPNGCLSSVQLIDWNYNGCTTYSSQRKFSTKGPISYRKSEKQCIRPLKKFNLRSDDVLIGSSRGLTCFVINNDVVVQNLFTGLCWKFAAAYNKRHRGYIGFGYVSSIDDYKLVRSEDVYYDDYEWGREVEIITLKTHTRRRRRIPDAISTDMSPNYNISSVLFNETLHWRYSSSSNIYSFSLEEERYRIFPGAETSYTGNMVLGVLAGCLCMVDLTVLYPTGRMDVWVMKEYGVAGSWTKLVSVSLPDDYLANSLMPLGIVNNDEIVIIKSCSSSLMSSSSGSELSVFSVRGKSFRDFKLSEPLGENVICAIHTEIDLELECEQPLALPLLDSRKRKYNIALVNR